jgi:diguanylate cyclase (GGDEF)-like protein/PAS domain S-box-containing protein
VSGRRRAQEALRVATDRLDRGFHDAPIGMALLDLHGRFLGVNRPLCELLGLPEPELIDRDVSTVVAGPDQRRVQAYLRLLRVGGQGSRSGVEVRAVTAAGATVDVAVTASLARDAAGRPVQITAHVEDLTGRRQTEAQLIRERTFIEAVLANLDVGVIACDADGELTVWNDAATRLQGMALRPRPAETWPSAFRLYHPDGVTPLTPDEVPLRRALRGEQVRNVEVSALPDGGDPRTVVANARPITGGNGEIVGAVVALHDVTARKAAEAALARQALLDPLTGLANRLLLRDRLEHALSRRGRRREHLAVLFIDLDGFKTINDSLGHGVGDEVLVLLAERLRGCLRPVDTAARLGGDEFAVVLEDTPEAEAFRVGERVLAALSGLLEVAGRRLVVTASIGVATTASALTAETLLRNADLAMYAAKARGKGRCELFHSRMHHNVLRRLTLEADLRDAVERRELAVHYQPIVDLRRGGLAGVEALLRWPTHRGVEIPPGQFIPVAESSGLIRPLGEWVLREACAQAARWRAEHTAAADLSVSVNLSGRQLGDPGFVELIFDALRGTRLDPGALVLEVTESALMEVSDVVPALERLRAAGVRVAIDDFGTGYSSLSRLRALPVDKVKIDRSFVAELDQHERSPLVAGIIALAHTLGLEVVAEGVETARQLGFLQGHDCDEAQGYLLGRPTDPGHVERLIIAAAVLPDAG